MRIKAINKKSDTMRVWHDLEDMYSPVVLPRGYSDEEIKYCIKLMRDSEQPKEIVQKLNDLSNDIKELASLSRDSNYENKMRSLCKNFGSVMQQTQDKRMGAISDSLDRRDYPVDTLLKTSGYSDLPVSVDYSDSMAEIKNQGGLGSCVAFAVCAVREWQEKKEYKQEKEEGSTYEREEEYDLSELFLYTKCKEIDGYPNQEGTTIRSAMKVMYNEGVPQEKAWEYNDKMEGEPESWSNLTARWRKIENYYRISNITEAREVLNTGGPFVSGVYCFPGMFNPDDGVVPMPSNNASVIGGHAIAICGYDDVTGLLKFKNSWSDNWGDGGFGYIHYDYFSKFSIDNWFPVDKSVKELF